MKKTIVFIHGAWVTPLCWEYFIPFFEEKGYRCIAPTWPLKDRSIEELRSRPDKDLPMLGVKEIVDHYADIIRALDEPPILIGHSFGGLFVQMLLDRGLGRAGVAINSAPPKSILPLQPSVIRSFMKILLTPFGWRKVHRWTGADFAYAFLPPMPEDEVRQLYERYVVPETGRIFYQAAFSLFHDQTRVDFSDDRRAPLLLIAGSKDRVCPAAQNRANLRRYRHSKAITEYKEFPNRYHWIIAQEGWQEVAGFVDGWLQKRA
jgi:pimeloyl-ACP methyl ester carboxylesterase